MPIIILKKSDTTRKSIELGLNKDGGMHLKSSTVIRMPRKELYKLEFKFRTTQFSHPRDQLIEHLEWLSWVNSKTKEQAESIGWVEDANKLPVFDNARIYLPHAIYYDKSVDQEFMRTYCSHISAIAPEAHEGISSSSTTYRRVRS